MKVNSDTPACPECESSWVGREIPPEHREAFGGRANFSRAIALTGTETAQVVMICPDCKARFEYGPR